jgi:hypothetical protein
MMEAACAYKRKQVRGKEKGRKNTSGAISAWPETRK